MIKKVVVGTVPVKISEGINPKTLIIHNRSGNVIYLTSDPTQPTTEGIPIHPEFLKQTLDASSARTSSVAGNSIDLSIYEKVEIEVNVIATAGTPTLDIKVQTSNDDSTYIDAVYINGSTAITFTQITGVSTQSRQFDFYGKYLRLYFTIAGTSPSFTFSTVITAKRKEPQPYKNEYAKGDYFLVSTASSLEARVETH